MPRSPESSFPAVKISPILKSRSIDHSFTITVENDKEIGKAATYCRKCPLFQKQRQEFYPVACTGIGTEGRAVVSEITNDELALALCALSITKF